MYKIYNCPIRNCPVAILRLSDEAMIPFDERNSDYIKYLKWIEEGNQPLPAD